MSSEEATSAVESGKDAAATPSEGSASSAEGSTVRSDRAGSEKASSRPGSRGGSGAGSRPGSAAGSRPGSRPGSAADSRPGSQPGSAADSRPGSAAGSVPPDPEDGSLAAAERDGPTSDDVTGDPEAAGADQTGSRNTSADGDGPVASPSAVNSTKTATRPTREDAEPMETDGTRTSADNDQDESALVIDEPEPSEDRSFTVINVESQSGGDDNPADGQKRSPMKKIRVISSATVGSLGDSEEEDDPVLVPTVDTNGDVTEVTRADKVRNAAGWGRGAGRMSGWQGRYW